MAYPVDPDDPTNDLASGVVTYSTRLVNVALSRIGVSRQLANVATDDYAEAVAARLHLTPALNYTLAHFDWPFARRRATLDTPVEGDGTTPANGDWAYGFRVPDDCYVMRRIVSQALTGGRVNAPPIPFEMGADDTSPIIYCDLDEIEIVYTSRPADLVRLGSPSFRSASAWRLAAELVHPLARQENYALQAAQMFVLEVNAAAANAFNEAQPDKPGDASWILGR